MTAARTTAEKLADLQERTLHAMDPGSERAKQRRDAAGKATPRQRIDTLLDPGSFVEMGLMVKSPGNPSNPPTDGVVTGRGTIYGRPVVVFAHDVSVFGGSVGEGFGRKVCAVMEFGIKTGCPIIGINDSGGARVQDAVTSLAYYSEIGRRQYAAAGVVPQISVMLGKCAGGAVYSPVCSDFVVADREQAYMFITGPDIIKAVTGEDISIEELGNAMAQAHAGNVTHVAENEKAALDWTRELLQFLPSTSHERPPRINPGIEPERTESDLELNSIIPDSDNAAYDMHDVLLHMFDDGDVFEMSEDFAPNIITAFARVDGRPVGIIANQPMHLSGCLDVDSSEKAARFAQICNSYDLPIVCVVDIPGYLPGIEQERMGIIHRGAKFLYSIVDASVPKVTVIVRKAYGGGYAVMGSKNLGGGDLNFAWPTARIAVMGAEGAVDLLQRRQIEEAGEDGPALRKQLIDMYNEFIATPYTAAERGYIDAVIEPADTRLILRKALAQLEDKKRLDIPRKRPVMPL